MTTPVRAIALYLPQFHPIPENNAWWGSGFTEWTNTAKAKPLYRGHYQPHVPADLGFYDLRVPETRVAQAELARNAGIEGFCYYHYWFAGRRILERPFNEVLVSGEPDFPFCLCWANETWSGIWHGEPNRILIEQTHPGAEDHCAHFTTLLPAFADRRHMRVEDKPIFFIWKPEEIPDCAAAMNLWRDMATRAGLGGLHIVGFTSRTEWNPHSLGLDAKVLTPRLNERPWISRRHPLKWLKQKFDIHRGLPTLHPYDDRMGEYIVLLERNIRGEFGDFPTYPCVIHAWDNTPRSGVNGVVLTGAGPDRFRRYVGRSIDLLTIAPAERRLLLLKSWNEWAEGNHLEPDLRDGHAYLDVLREELARPRFERNRQCRGR